VTTRRLRVTLPLFDNCFRKKDHKIWTKEIKKTTTLLSQARDLDVQITFIEQYIKTRTNPEEKNHLNLLLKNHKTTRQTLQTPVNKGIEELKNNNTINNLTQNCEETLTKQQPTQPPDPTQVLQKAHWHISHKLDDFLSMTPYVYWENEKLKHHQMRIYAKKLRYTMECFAPLYPDKLNNEINTIKTFQDTLGEIHDSDVWLDFIPKFNQKIQNNPKTPEITKLKINQTLQNFQICVATNRKKHYDQFIKLWETNKKSHFFEKLRKKTSTQYIALIQEKLRQNLTEANLKIAVISDVHANLHALKKVLANAKTRGASIILNAGDSIGFGAYPNEVIELLCEKNVLSIKGNYDTEVLQGKNDTKGQKKISFKFAKKTLTPAVKWYLKSLPPEMHLKIGDKTLLITHGSPASINEHLHHDTPTKRLKTLATKAQADIIVVGHSHQQFQRQVQNVCFVNPGSVGRPDDGNPQTGYALLSFSPFKVELIRLDYNVEAATKALRKNELPESFAQMLLHGVSIDTITEKDQNKIVPTDTSNQKTLRTTRKFARNLWPDVNHYTQVTNLALTLFDNLSALHKLGKWERNCLQYAAILHDVGLSKGRNKHHKTSMETILNSTQLPFTSNDRRVIASITRYHRKNNPKQNHYNLATLEPPTIHKVCILASLLRLADSLDYTHSANIKLLGVKIVPKKVTIECESKTDFRLEEQSFNKKKDLFEKVFQRRIMVVWKD